MTLDQLQPQDRAEIASVAGDDAVSRRLLEMGLLEGESIEMVRSAPLGDPVEYFVRGTRLALRRNEARRISVTSDVG